MQLRVISNSFFELYLARWNQAVEINYDSNKSVNKGKYVPTAKK
jgi:hypothetical protein